MTAYKRVLLKLSGEAFADRTGKESIDGAVVARIADEIQAG